MGDDETVGEIVEPEVEDLKSDAWRHLKKIFHFFRRVKKIPEKMKVSDNFDLKESYRSIEKLYPENIGYLTKNGPVDVLY